MNRTLRLPLSAALLLVLSAKAVPAQISFPEVEPNSNKAESTVVAPASGDALTGTTTGASTTSGSSLITTVDTFRVQPSGAGESNGIYQRRITFTTSGTAGHEATLRGWSQAGGVIGTVNTTVQTSSVSSSPPRFVQWYGFTEQIGRDQVYVRVSGTAATTMPYVGTFSSTAVSTNPMGTFMPGAITFSTAPNSDPMSDTEIVVLDGNFTPVAANDDASGFGPNSNVTATLAAGHYYVAVGNSGLALNLAATAGDLDVDDPVLDFDFTLADEQRVADQICLRVSDSAALIVDVCPQISGEYHIEWYELDVAAPVTTYPEFEPNGDKSEATQVVCMLPGERLSGTTTGTSTTIGDATSTSADTFRVTGCPPGQSALYVHSLTLTSATPGHVLTIRGLDQLNGSIVPGTDATVQTASISGASRTVRWYGGEDCDLYVRVTGNAGTTAPYQITYDRTMLDAQTIDDLGTLQAGAFTIAISASSDDLELALLDEGIYVATASNDDSSLGGILPLMTANLNTTHFWLVGVALSNLATHLDYTAGEQNIDTSVMDFPGTTVAQSNLASGGYTLTVSNSNGQSVQRTHALSGPQEIRWYRLGIDTPIDSVCDGTGACPCGNTSTSGGCLSSLGTGGLLTGTGIPSIASDTLVLHGSAMPNSSALYFQGTLVAGNGAGNPFGDGLRCAAGSVIRLGTKLNSGGGSQYPLGADALIHVKGAIAVAGSRVYQIWYRNAAAFCTASTFNLSNGLQVAWSL